MSLSCIKSVNFSIQQGKGFRKLVKRGHRQLTQLHANADQNFLHEIKVAVEDICSVAPGFAGEFDKSAEVTVVEAGDLHCSLCILVDADNTVSKGGVVDFGKAPDSRTKNWKANIRGGYLTVEYFARCVTQDFNDIWRICQATLKNRKLVPECHANPSLRFELSLGFIACLFSAVLAGQPYRESDSQGGACSLHPARPVTWGKSTPAMAFHKNTGELVNYVEHGNAEKTGQKTFNYFHYFDKVFGWKGILA